MGWTLFFAFVALLIGWSTPQPPMAKAFTDWVVYKWQSLMNRDSNKF